MSSKTFFLLMAVWAKRIEIGEPELLVNVTFCPFSIEHPAGLAYPCGLMFTGWSAA